MLFAVIFGSLAVSVPRYFEYHLAQYLSDYLDNVTYINQVSTIPMLTQELRINQRYE